MRWDEAKARAAARTAGADRCGKRRCSPDGSICPCSTHRLRRPRCWPTVPVAEPGGRPLTSDDHAIAIGPEGGWSPAELSSATTVDLGPHVLRVETAAVVAATLLVHGRDGRAMTAPFGWYVHVPFCGRRCDYCAFATWTDRHHLIDDYLEAMRVDIERAVEAGGPGRGHDLRRWRHPDPRAGRGVGRRAGRHPASARGRGDRRVQPRRRHRTVAGHLPRRRRQPGVDRRAVDGAARARRRWAARTIRTTCAPPSPPCEPSGCRPSIST